MTSHDALELTDELPTQGAKAEENPTLTTGRGNEVSTSKLSSTSPKHAMASVTAVNDLDAVKDNSAAPTISDSNPFKNLVASGSGTTGHINDLFTAASRAMERSLASRTVTETDTSTKTFSSISQSAPDTVAESIAAALTTQGPNNPDTQASDPSSRGDAPDHSAPNLTEGSSTHPREPKDDMFFSDPISTQSITRPLQLNDPVVFDNEKMRSTLMESLENESMALPLGSPTSPLVQERPQTTVVPAFHKPQDSDTDALSESMYTPDTATDTSQLESKSDGSPSPSYPNEVSVPVNTKTPEQMKRLEDLIRDVPLLQNIDQQKRAILSNTMTEVHYRAGESLTIENDEGGYVYVVESGTLDCFKKRITMEGEDNDELAAAPPPYSETPLSAPVRSEMDWCPHDSERTATYTRGDTTYEVSRMCQDGIKTMKIVPSTPCVLWVFDLNAFQSLKLDADNTNVKAETNMLASVSPTDELLAYIPFLRSLSDVERQHLDSYLRICEFNNGELVFREDDKGNKLYVVEEGEAEDFTVAQGRDDNTQETGSEEIVLQKYGCGDYFGGAYYCYLTL